MISPHNTPAFLAEKAIESLKNAYETCEELRARESIITAFKAVIQLSVSLDEHPENSTWKDSESDCDPCELCAAV